MDKYRARYQIDKLKALYSEYSALPIPSKAYLLSEPSSKADSPFVPQLIKVNWQYRDTIQVKTVTFQKNYLCSRDLNIVPLGLPEELSSETSLQAFSTDGKKQAILKSKKSDAKNGKPEQFIVVYDEGKPIKTIDVKSLNDQMTIIESATYSNFILNDSGTVLLCVVEVNPKKTKKDESPASKDYDIDSHEYKQSWGETLSSIYHSSIAVVDLQSEKLSLIEKAGLSLIQPFFFKQADSATISVGCIGLQELPYKLGLVYCTHRVSFLLGAKVPTKFADSEDSSPIEPEVYYGNSGQLSLSSPRVFYSKTNGYDCKAIFLERDAGGAHDKSARLQSFCFESRKSVLILDNKERRALVNETTYSDVGPLFLDNLPVNCFTSSGRYALLSSETPLSSKPFAVDLEKKELKLLASPHDFCQVWDVKDDWVVALGSSVNVTPNVYLCNLASSDSDLSTPLKWTPVEDEAPKKLPNIVFDTFAFPARDHKDKLVTCIWTSPADLVDTVGPTIILAHGGPHGQLPTCYMQVVALFTELGIKVCLLNYVGSTGVDEEYVNCLLGKIGTSDIHDMYDTIQYVIAHKKADKNQIILYGGSHSGFMVTSISGQHPELNFLACIARNPVIDITAMSAISDIPDWCISEALGPETLLPLADIYAKNEEQAAILNKVSPINHVQNVKVPTLLLLGKEDLRVPYSQGLLYHRILKARGIETRCFIYDDCHGLAKIDVNYDGFLNTVKFIEKFIFYSP